MPVDFYHMDGSAPCRAVRMAAKALGVELNLIQVNLLEGEQLKPEFIKLNPQHTIPTLVDGDLAIGESRAQMCYLANKYGGEDNKLYPKCPEKRALVDRYLYFDLGTFYKNFGEYFYPTAFGKGPASEEKITKVKEALQFLEEFLGDKKFLLGDDYTLADLALGASLSMFEAANFDYKDFKKATAYYERLTALPFWNEINASGIEFLRGWFASANKA